jgi:predicted enzyme related to lactoylglutathione lyase
MTSGFSVVIYPVDDLSRAKERFERLLGTAPYADEPYYVGFRVDGQEIGLDPHGHSHGMTGPIGYCEVENIEESIWQLVESGAEIKQPARDVGGGKLIATVEDPDGNVIGLIQSP